MGCISKFLSEQYKKLSESYLGWTPSPKRLTDWHCSFLLFNAKDIFWETVVADPRWFITYAISSVALATFSWAETLLVLLVCVTNLSATQPFPGMLVWSGDQPMNRTRPHHFTWNLLLLSNPRVVDQLPSQSLTKDQESRTSFDPIVAKDEVSQRKEHIDLRNPQDETEDPTLPPLCYPSILDQWQRMS